MLCILTASARAQTLTQDTLIEITATWTQQPEGWTYPISIDVPDEMPKGGFPVCILLHGANNEPEGLMNSMREHLPNHVLVGPSGYLQHWNICNEPSDAPDVEMIEELVNRLQTYENINPDAIRLIGSSNGAALANRVFIENRNPGIDAVVTVISQLSEIQFRNDSYRKPADQPVEEGPFCGYLESTDPLTTRRYLNICNVNDGTIPYEGGYAAVSGISYLEARIAAYHVARKKGFKGPPDLSDGNQLGDANIWKYAYLNDTVIHLRGFEDHGWNPQMRAFTGTFLSTWPVESNCTGDFDGDGEVGGADLATLLSKWDSNDTETDLDGNGIVEGADLAIILGKWGLCR